MNTDDVEVVRRFRKAIADGDLEASEAVLSPDVEWVVSPAKTLRGIDAVRGFYAGKPSGGPENLDVAADLGELEDLGGGRVSAVNHHVFRWKETGELAYERRARIDYTIRDGLIVRYEATILEE